MTNRSIKNILKNQDLLNILIKSKPKLRKNIILNSDKKFIKALCESILNVLNGNIPIDESQYNKLKKSKSTLRKLVSESTNIDEKKKLLGQRGGFLNIIIPAVISGLASIVGSIIEKE